MNKFLLDTGGHPNTQDIWIPDFYYSVIQMVKSQVADRSILGWPILVPDKYSDILQVYRKKNTWVLAFFNWYLDAIEKLNHWTIFKLLIIWILNIQITKP